MLPLPPAEEDGVHALDELVAVVEGLLVLTRQALEGERTAGRAEVGCAVREGGHTLSRPLPLARGVGPEARAVVWVAA